MNHIRYLVGITLRASLNYVLFGQIFQFHKVTEANSR